MKTENKTLIDELRQKATELIATDSITSSVELILLADDFDRCADRLEELTKENADLKAKLDLCSKWQPMDTAPDKFIGITNKWSCLECEFVKTDNRKRLISETHDTIYYRFPKEFLGWIPMPEGTEGL